MCFSIFENEKTCFLAIKQEVQKVEKLPFFREQPIVSVKNWPFFQLFFQAVQARLMSFTIFQSENTPFQAVNTRRLIKWKNCHFSKGVSPWFWSKIGHVSIFFLKVIQGKKMCFAIFQNEKNVFVSYKKKKFKKSKNCHFSKGVNAWFWSKIGHISKFFPKAIQQRKMCFQIFQNEKTPFQAIKERS